MSDEWVVLIAVEELLGSFGKVLIGVGVSSVVLSGIMGFYLASSRLMYCMAHELVFGQCQNRLMKEQMGTGLEEDGKITTDGLAALDP